jgi:PAS domain S-box-containing protein
MEAIERVQGDMIELRSRARGFALSVRPTFFSQSLFRRSLFSRYLALLTSAVLGSAILLSAAWFLIRQIELSADTQRELYAEIEARKGIEERLQASQRQLAGIIESAMDAIVTVNEDHKVVIFNRAAEQIFGYRAREVMGGPLDRFLPAGLRLAHAGHVRDFARTGATTRSMGDMGILRAMRSDGTEFPIEASISQLQSAGRRLFTVILRDVTERQHREEELRELNQALDLAPVLVRDMEARIVLWNGGCEKLYGYSKSEAVGSFSHALLRTEFPQPLEGIEEELNRAGRWEGDMIHYRRDGKQLVINSQWALHHDAAGRPMRVVEAHADITESRVAEQGLRQLNQELEERVRRRTADLEAANNELEAFTYSVSHDLRAPIRHIAGFSRMLAEEGVSGMSAEAGQHLERIQEGARRMAVLVDDLLNLSRIGRHPLQAQVTGLDAVVRAVIDDLAPELEGRAVEWKIGELPYVEGDPSLLKQVFQNLLANALKYSRPRAVAVIELGTHNNRARENRTQENGTQGNRTEENENEPIIFVRDNGVGFNMKYADKLFGVFQRLHRQEDFEGTGVGLATVQSIVRRHGGRIWAHAEVDQGATFYFTLRAVDAAPPLCGGRRSPLSHGREGSRD